MKKMIAMLLAVVLVASAAATSVFGVTAVESIRRKPGPIIIIDEDDYDVYDEEGNVVDHIDGEKIVVTPISHDEEAEEEIRDSLREAYEELTEEDITELVQEIEDIIKEDDPNNDPDDLITEDVFDISIIDEEDIVTKDIDGEIEIEIDIGLEDGEDTPYFIIRNEDGEWSVIHPKDITRDENNHIHIRLRELGVIATLIFPKNYGVEDPEVFSPQTGFNPVPYVLAAVSAVVLVSCVAVLVIRKKKES